jgi:RHS repeat-associated protein
VLASAPENDSGCAPSNQQPGKCPGVVVEPPGGVGWEGAVRPATYYYHPDHLGSTSWVTDELARVHEHVEYFPFGQVWREARQEEEGAPVRAPHFLFSAKEYDEETGLGYFSARYYDARRARWVSADPFREEWGSRPPPALLSVYAYGYQSPLGWRDTTGKVPEWLHAGLDVAGVVPGIGEVADGVNGLLYLIEGRYVEAGISAMGMIPLVGDAGKAGRWAVKGVKSAGEGAAGKVVAKEVGGEALEQGGKAVKEVCFAAGTPVTTKEGLKPIEEVREGEEVWARDEETGRVGWKRVVRTYVREGVEVWEVVWVGPGGAREKVRVTAEHPFRVEGRGWVEARKLEPGSRILTPGEAWLRTESVAETLARVTVYNFEVEDYHTYFVGSLQAWVHNSCGPKTAPNPYGKKGGPAHQNKVNEVAADIKDRGLKVGKEHMVPTPGGHKEKRFVDVVAIDPGTKNVVEMHQVGRQTKGGNPVSREVKALDDIQKSTGVRPTYHSYDRGSPLVTKLISS